MDCLDDDRLAEFVQGSLGPVERDSIDQHLDSCESCTRLLAAAMRMADDPVIVSEDSAQTVALTSEGQIGTPAQDLPASLADGRYLIRDQIGQGGAGAVYRAYDSQLSRFVAVKVVRTVGPSDHTTHTLQSRMRSEARAMAQVTHPNVVTVYDVGTVSDSVFIVMELVNGRTLERWLGEQPRTWREVVSTFIKAARGLAAAHHAGLVHRDFKPLNVLVGDDERVLVTDFGLARPFTNPATIGDALQGTETAMTAGLAGTPRYMSPEQFTGHTATAQSDQFSFCVALFAALYGRHPFLPPAEESSRVEQIAQTIVSGQLKLPGLEKDVPQDLLVLLRTGLAGSSTERHVSMDTLIVHLERLLEAPQSVVGRRNALVSLTIVGALALVTWLAWPSLRGSSGDKGQVPSLVAQAPEPILSSGHPISPSENGTPPTRSEQSKAARDEPQEEPKGLTPSTPAQTLPAPKSRTQSTRKPQPKPTATPPSKALDPDRLKDPFSR